MSSVEATTLLTQGATHGLWEALTTGGLGIVLPASFDNEGFSKSLPWQFPPSVYFLSGRGQAILQKEVLWGWLLWP